MSIFSSALPIVGGIAGAVLGGPAGAAAGAAIGGTIGGVAETREAEVAQGQAARAQRRIAAIRDKRARVKQVREATIQRGAIENVAAASGAPGSSRTAGATSSLSSQLGTNLAYSAQTQVFANQATSALQRSSDAMSNAAIFNSISAIGFNLGKDAKFDRLG